MLQAQLRVITFLLRLRDGFPEQNLAVFSHADVIRAAVAYFLGVPLDLFQRIEVSPASISIISLSEFGAQVWGVNDCRACR